MRGDQEGVGGGGPLSGRRRGWGGGGLAPTVAPGAGAPPVAPSGRALPDAPASGALPAAPSCAAPVPRVTRTVEAPGWGALCNKKTDPPRNNCKRAHFL